MLYLSNAFSLNMLDPADVIVNPRIPIPISNPRNFLKDKVFKSIVGHEDTARVMSKILDTYVDFNRESITLKGDDQLLVGQYTGPRLPAGATSLPVGATITWWLI